MHFLFNLLRIKGLYIFRALLAHPQEVLRKRHLVYCLRVMSVGGIRVGVEPSLVLSLRAICSVFNFYNLFILFSFVDFIVIFNLVMLKFYLFFYLFCNLICLLKSFL
jgi:hypothetical protein